MHCYNQVLLPKNPPWQRSHDEQLAVLLLNATKNTHNCRLAYNGLNLDCVMGGCRICLINMCNLLCILFAFPCETGESCPLSIEPVFIRDVGDRTMPPPPFTRYQNVHWWMHSTWSSVRYIQSIRSGVVSQKKRAKRCERGTVLLYTKAVFVVGKSSLLMMLAGWLLVNDGEKWVSWAFE